MATGETRLFQELCRMCSIASRLDLNDLLLRYDEQVTQGRRPALSAPIFNRLRSYGPTDYSILDPPSSDENSDVECGCPSLRTTMDSVLDSKVCEITDSFSNATFHQPALIILNVHSKVTAVMLKERVQDLCSNVWKAQVVDFPLERSFCRCGILYFDSLPTASKVFTHLHSEEDSDALSHRINAAFDPLKRTSVRWFLNRMQDPETTWAGIVIRDMAKLTSGEDLLAFMREQGLRPVRVEAPRAVYAGTCAIVIFDSVETAEHACKQLHKKLCLGAIWKVHVHPLSHAGKTAKPRRREAANKDFGYSDLMQMMRTEKKGVEAVVNEDPLKRLIRKRGASKK